MAFKHAKAFKASTLGDGIIKDFFTRLIHTVEGEEPTLQRCAIPTCKNKTPVRYCQECLALGKDSAATHVLKTMATFLGTR